jgi:hypothetical protein
MYTVKAIRIHHGDGRPFGDPGELQLLIIGTKMRANQSEA